MKLLLDISAQLGKWRDSKLYTWHLQRWCQAQKVKKEWWVIKMCWGANTATFTSVSVASRWGMVIMCWKLRSLKMWKKNFYRASWMVWSLQPNMKTAELEAWRMTNVCQSSIRLCASLIMIIGTHPEPFEWRLAIKRLAFWKSSLSHPSHSQQLIGTLSVHQQSSAVCSVPRTDQPR